MLSALGVILLYVGSIIQVADLSMAVLASLLCVFAVIEYGKTAPWLVFGVTSVLSLVLLPQKTPAVVYTLFFGFYPILKERFEKFDRIRCIVFKELVFNAALIVILLAMKFLFLEFTDIPFMLYLIAIVLCEAVFLVYDFALTRLISLYVYKLRKRFRIK